MKAEGRRQKAEGRRQKAEDKELQGALLSSDQCCSDILVTRSYCKNCEKLIIRRTAAEIVRDRKRDKIGSFFQGGRDPILFKHPLILDFC